LVLASILNHGFPPVAIHIQPFSGLLDVNLAITAKRYNQ
jgi:hypothetical protein